MAEFDGDPGHPIIDTPGSWELLEFTFRRDPVDRSNSYIDMVFERGGNVKRLRFYSPQQLWIPEGLPNTLGMIIVDVSARGLEGLGVRVANFEDSWGSPSFWAASVVEVVEQQRRAEPSVAADAAASGGSG